MLSHKIELNPYRSCYYDDCFLIVEVNAPKIACGVRYTIYTDARDAWAQSWEATSATPTIRLLIGQGMNFCPFPVGPPKGLSDGDVIFVEMAFWIENEPHGRIWLTKFRQNSIVRVVV